MTRYGMVIDETLCNGCYSCVLACRDEYAGNDYPGYSSAQPMTGMNWIRMVETERGRYPKVKVAYTSVSCMHCEQAPCVDMSEDGAVYRRADGIVMVDPVKARAQKGIVATCPYRVIEWNEEQQLPQKCTMCAHLIDQGWKEPRCAEACPTRAIVFGDLDDPESDVAKLLASGATEALHPEFALKENVTYIGLPKRFIAGSLVQSDTGLCAEEVSVTIADGTNVWSTTTDTFGDFEIDGLAEYQSYTVTLAQAGYHSVELPAFTRTDVYLGEVFLEPSTT